MSKPFQSINDVINTTSKHKQQSFNELYGEPENFLEIEVCKSLMSDTEYNPKAKSLTYQVRNPQTHYGKELFTDYEIICRVSIILKYPKP